MENNFYKFCIVGSFGFFVDISVLYLCIYITDDFIMGRLISFITAIATTWALNRRFTFADIVEKQEKSTSKTIYNLWRYYAAVSLGSALNYFVYAVTITTVELESFTPAFSVLVGSAVGLIFNYSLTSKWIWRQT